jgi:hypothetical protein
MENKENKVANSFLADRMAGLVDELGNPIPQEKKEDSPITVEEPIIQTEIANSFLANRMAGLVDELGNPIPQEGKEEGVELEEPIPFVVEEDQTEVENTVVE